MIVPYSTPECTLAPDQASKFYHARKAKEYDRLNEVHVSREWALPSSVFII